MARAGALLAARRELLDRSVPLLLARETLDEAALVALVAGEGADRVSDTAPLQT